MVYLGLHEIVHEPMVGQRSTVMSMSVCIRARARVCVCVRACVCVYKDTNAHAEYVSGSQTHTVSLWIELHVQSSPFLCMLPTMAVDRSSSGVVAIRHLLPVNG